MTKRASICVIALESKRSLSLEGLSNICLQLSACGYYADKVCRIAYDNSGDIVREITEAKTDYENIFVFFPFVMDGTVKSFISSLFHADFDGLGVLNSGESSVFLFYTDRANRLNFTDVKSVLDCKYSICYEKAFVKACAPKEVVDSAVEKARMRFASSGVDASINVNYEYGDTRIEILYSSQASKIAFDEALRGLIESLDEYVYAVEDVSLAEQLFRLLKLRRLKISVAESFTGGGVGKALVEVSGVSEVYFEGLNTYSNEAKIKRLGVSEVTLKQFGAVSAETACEMAEGLVKTGDCHVAISTTGIAGPNSDNSQKPVGLAYIGIALNDDVSVYKFNFSGNREAITRAGINQALFLAYKKIK